MKKKILIVDDNRTNLIYASKILSGDYSVLAALSGEKAIEICLKKEPDLMLLDISMPVMDGFQVMDHLQQDDRLCRIPVIFLTASGDVETEVLGMEKGAADFIVKPFVPKIMLSRIKRTLELEEYKKSLESLVERQVKEISQIQNEVIIGMANLIECRDGSTGVHVKRTSSFVKIMAQELRNRGHFMEELTDKYIHNLCKASPMHDIGKIAISDLLLKKPGRLTLEEFDVMKTHSSEGGRILKQIMSKIEKKEYVDIAFDVATYHHERWDGTGYPTGIKGNEIPLSARIMAIADVFDALISKRCYKEAIPVDEALGIIKESKGSHFDPLIAQVFLDMEESIKRTIIAVSES